MAASPNVRTTVHLLSDKSMKQKRDTFLFYHSPGVGFSMIGGMNSRRYELTVAQFYRWMDILDDKPEEPKFNFLIWRIEVTRFDVLCYTCKIIGSPLPRASNEKLEPGDYCAYLDDGNGGPGGLKIIGPWASPTFRKLEIGTLQMLKNVPTAKNKLEHNILTAELIREVKERDEGVCWLTGEAANSTEISWIVPPAWSIKVNSIDRYDDDRDKAIIEDHKVSGNAITLDARLAEVFMMNRFGVDVDDNYQIVQFQNAPKGVVLRKRLSKKMVAISKQNNDRFLRGQFKWCLKVHFLGGDARDDYPDGGGGLAEEAADYGIDLDDPKWHTPIGREVREVMEMHEEILDSDSDSDSDY